MKPSFRQSTGCRGTGNHSIIMHSMEGVTHSAAVCTLTKPVKYSILLFTVTHFINEGFSVSEGSYQD